MTDSHFSPNVYSSDSDVDADKLPKKVNKFKHPKNNSMKQEYTFIGLEEGEISSDDLDDEDDDGLDDNLIGGEDDKRKLEKMSEKEREEELFKRAERRDAIQARRAVKQKLKEKRDKERAEKAAGLTKSAELSTKIKKSAYSDVFSSDTEEGARSDSSGGAGPRGLRRRKVALEKRKEEHSHKFHELIQQRRQQAAKKRRVQSDDEDTNDVRRNAHEHSFSSAESSSNNSRQKSRKRINNSHHKRHGKSMSQRVFSSDDASDSTESSQPGGAHMTQQRRASFSSLSCSQRSASSSDDDRGRSRSPVEELVSEFEQLSKIRLSRFKMEKWVHMPFFDDLVRGCFVRLNIGINQGVPVYRCAEIVNVLETPKIYDLGATRTNKGIVVRIGKDQSTLRLAFVSNSNFTQEEFDSWLRRVTEANMRPPTLAFVDRKAAEIQDAISRPIRDERVVNQIIQSKRRFQKAPTNFAMRKAELMKQREIAEADGDAEQLRVLDSQLEEIESQAERIERRRTLGFKSITSINQRNRALSVQQAEEAIRKESEEAQRSTEDDPYTRVHSQPVIVTKKYLEQLRQKRNELSQNSLTDTSDVLANATGTPLNHSQSMRNLCPSTPSASMHRDVSTPSLYPPLTASMADDGDISGLSSQHESLHSIHNFEINIDLEMDGNVIADSQLQHQQPQPQVVRRAGYSTSSTPRTGRLARSSDGAPALSGMDSVDGLGSTPQAVGGTGPTSSATRPNRWLLKLQEHKKKHNLI